MEFNEAPFSYFTLVALNRDTNRGAKITSIAAEKENDEPYSQVRVPAKIVSINGERCTKYVFRNIERSLSNSNHLPIRLRLEDYDANAEVNSNKHKSGSSFDVSASQSDNEGGNFSSGRPKSASHEKRRGNFRSNNNNHRRTKSSMGRNDSKNSGGRYGAYNVRKTQNRHMRSESFKDENSYDNRGSSGRKMRVTYTDALFVVFAGQPTRL